MKHIIVIVKDQKELDIAVREMSNLITEKKVPVSIAYINKHGKLKYLVIGNILNNHLFIQPNHHLLDKVGLKYNYQFLNVK